MSKSFPPARPLAPSAEPLTARRIPLWLATLFTLAAAALAALLTQAWLLRDLPPHAPGLGAPGASLQPLDFPPPAAGKVPRTAPAMLYGMLPLHSGHGLRDEQCRQLAVEAMKEAGLTDIDADEALTLFARQGDYALFVGCHLDQKLVLVGAAGPVPEQAESLQEQLLRSLQTRF